MLQYIVLEHPFFVATGALYAASMAFYAAAWRSTQKLVGQLGTALMCAALALNLALITQRWIDTRIIGRDPRATVHGHTRRAASYQIVRRRQAERA